MRPGFAPPALALLLGAASVASAEDVVVLASGNRLTGSITELSRGELTFSIDGAGSVDIDWRNVVELRSPDRFYVELASGERYDGTVAVAEGRVTIGADAGARQLDLQEVVRIDPSSLDRFVERLSGSVDGGFDFLSANDEIDWTFNAAVEHRTRHYLTEVSLSTLLRRRNDTTAQRRNSLEIDSRRLLEDRWFVLGQLILEEDQELGLDSRVLLGAALGRTLRQSQRSVLAVYGGMDADREKFVGAGTDTVFELHGAVEWDWFDVGGDTELEFQAITYFAPETSRVRVELRGELRRDIANDFYWALHVFESYNSDPPGQLQKSDLGFGLTIGRSF